MSEPIVYLNDGFVPASKAHLNINADEALLTTTPYCVAPCTRINTTPVGNGKPGPVWRQLIEAWSKRVGMDVLAQIMNSSAPAADA